VALNDSQQPRPGRYGLRAPLRWVGNTVLLYAHALGLFAFGFGVYNFAVFLGNGSWRDGAKIQHAVLQAIESLLLVPVPIVIGFIVQQLLTSMAEPEAVEFSQKERSYSIAKQFLVGIIITLSGTALLDGIVSGDASWELLFGGAAVILSLSVFVFVNRGGAQE
jgi:hypothetical protein